MLLNKAYYALKPFIPWHVRIAARRRLARVRLAANVATWPIDELAGETPPGWPGWPDGKRFAFVLTHDVEGLKGFRRIERVMELESRYGFRSSFNLVPKGEYVVTDDIVASIVRAGFEVGVHGLEHDGKLYHSKPEFARKAVAINSYLDRWGAVGFRSPLMQHRLGWLHKINAEHDGSTFDTDPFEPEPDGVRTIFPFWVPGPCGEGFVELPYTLVQDFNLFVVLRERNIKKWTDKLDWIAQRGGMAMLITHPDYMSFDGSACARDEFPVSLYEELLNYVCEKYGKDLWAALPRDVNTYYRNAVPAEKRNTRRRICMVAHSHYDADNRIRRYAESLAARGDIVDVVSLQSSPNGPSHVLKGVNVFEIQKRPRNERGKWSYAWQLIRFLLGALRFVSRRHSSVRYDLLHIHNIPDFLVLSAVFAKWSGARLILDIHDLVPELFEGKFDSRPDSGYLALLKKIERLSCSYADHVIISNHLWQQHLVGRSVCPEKCSVFINHVDPSIFHRRTRIRTDGKFILLFPGSFQAHQGLAVAVKALARIRDLAPDCELHLYGGGGDRHSQGQLTRLAADLGIESRVRFCGSVPLDQIPQVMADADIGIVPKLADSFGNEAYSTKIMEFMSQGVPVVASRTAIDSYYFSDDTVCFFESGNDRAMADALLKVIGDEELRNRLSRNGIEYAARHDWGSRKKEYLSLVDSLCRESFEFGKQNGA
jgi:glycosyltransferase involved in cell wall biosynthesis